VLLLMYFESFSPPPLLPLLLPGMVPNAEFVQQVKQQFPNTEQQLVVVSAAAHNMAVQHRAAHALIICTVWSLHAAAASV
jgi:hypothetical protein